MEASSADATAEIPYTNLGVSGEQKPNSGSMEEAGDPTVFWCALPFILAHPSVAQNQQLVCNLTASSKIMRAAVLESLQGLLQIRVAGRHARKLVPWLSKYAALLASLTVHRPQRFLSERPLDRPCPEFLKVNLLAMMETLGAGEAAVADGLQRAASSGHLQLRALSAVAGHGCSSVAAALHCLPSSCLTSLHLAFYPTEQQQLDHLRVALAALTSLRQLQLQLPTHGRTLIALLEPAHLDLIEEPPILPPPGDSNTSSSSSSSVHGEAGGMEGDAARQPVIGLPHLTSLSVAGVINEDDLARLPCSLKQLTLTHSCRSRDAVQVPASEGERLSLQWQQLLQLTSLQLSSCCPASSGELALESEDVLPANVKQLSLSSPVSSIRPILYAKQLQQLTLLTVQLDAQQLQQLTGLQHLTSVQLSYNSSYHLDESAAAWSSLGSRLQDLTMNLARSDPSCISERVLQHLRTCQGLTRLELSNVGHIEATGAQFCAVLQQLTSLRKFEELGSRWTWAVRDVMVSP
jgi:hypothetical protein